MIKKGYKILFVIFGILVSCIKVNAQRDFKQGYIIDKKSDTIRGYILDRGKNLYKVCYFKRSPDDKITDYFPSDISSFRLENGKYFISKKVTIDSVVSMYFLEYLIKGKANIYYMRAERDYYFIEKENDKLYELTEDEKFFKDKYNSVYIMPPQFKRKLMAELTDCKDIFPEIENTELTHSSLIKLAKDYHNKICTNEQCVVFERKLKPVHVKFGFHAGLSLNTLNFGEQLVANYSPGSLLGCRIEFENAINWTDKISFIIDFAFQRFTNYTLNEKSDNSIDEIIYNGNLFYLATPNNYMNYQSSLDVNIKTMALKIPISISYTFLKSNIRPYIGAGFSNMFVLTQNKDFTLKRFSKEYNKSIPSFHVGFLGKAGAKYVLKNKRTVYLELNYEFIQNLDISQFLRFRTNIFSFLTGFSF